MRELPMIIVVFGAIVLVVDHLRRLFAAISLNRTIRDAIKHHPASVVPLLERLETRVPLPLALGGWVFLGLGVLMGVMIAVSDGETDREAMLAAAVVGVLGVGLLIANWWLARSATKSVRP